MKKLIVLVLIAVIAVYAVGRVKLAERSAANLLNEMDQLMLDGQGEELCNLLHEDVEVSATASMGGETQTVEGGREEFCDHLKTASAGLRVLKGQMQVAISRSDFTVERDWMHPWTAHYTYTEDTSIRIPKANVSMESQSDSTLTLVMTLKGVKILKVTSEPVVNE